MCRASTLPDCSSSSSLLLYFPRLVYQGPPRLAFTLARQVELGHQTKRRPKQSSAPAQAGDDPTLPKCRAVRGQYKHAEEPSVKPEMVC
jgi:hypothetical protein